MREDRAAGQPRGARRRRRCSSTRAPTSTCARLVPPERSSTRRSSASRAIAPPAPTASSCPFASDARRDPRARRGGRSAAAQRDGGAGPSRRGASCARSACAGSARAAASRGSRSARPLRVARAFLAHGRSSDLAGEGPDERDAERADDLTRARLRIMRGHDLGAPPRRTVSARPARTHAARLPEPDRRPLRRPALDVGGVRRRDRAPGRRAAARGHPARRSRRVPRAERAGAARRALRGAAGARRARRDQHAARRRRRSATSSSTRARSSSFVDPELAPIVGAIPHPLAARPRFVNVEDPIGGATGAPLDGPTYAEFVAGAEPRAARQRRRRRGPRHVDQLHVGHDGAAEGRHVHAPRRVPERARRGDRARARPRQRLPVDAAALPRQRLVLPVGGHRGGRRARAAAQGRPAPRSCAASARTASRTCAARRRCC